VPSLTLGRVKVDIRWRPQLYLKDGQARGIEEKILQHAVAISNQLVAGSPPAPPILTLGHLAKLADADYTILRAAVGRRFHGDYTTFRVRKREPRPGQKQEFRVICVPCEPLLKTQRWIARNVLNAQRMHEASCAYAPRSDICEAARVHAGARWLIKTDIRRFFESISEVAVFRVFRGIGYQPLVAFELARLTTRLGRRRQAYNPRWYGRSDRYGVIHAYQEQRLGHLPQGAPTSPMLANLVARALDDRVAAIAAKYSLRYTRYADDICLSSTDSRFGRARAREVVAEIFRAMLPLGFSPNIAKTHIVPPGGRKVVLGLLVDSARPRLSTEMRDRIRQHVYYLTHERIGPALHAARRGFASTIGLRNHVYGLVSYAQAIDPVYAEKIWGELKSVQWPM
jgi:RNA-directed DNA polymerase